MTTPVHIVALGCARNDVDSEELAARLHQGGFELVDDLEAAEVVVVNTCGFIEAAKAESISTIIDIKHQADTRTVIATGCLAQRYGAELAEALVEVDAVIGFDGYPNIAQTIHQVMAQDRINQPADSRPQRHQPARLAQPTSQEPTPTEWLPSQRRRLNQSVWAPLKIASGCDRRCSFCAIPAIRGGFRSRMVTDIVDEATWLATQGVKELFLVSENTTAYGKDLPDRRSLETVLKELSSLDGIEWIRLSYLQPAEVRPWQIEAIQATQKVVEYYDLPFQHASAKVLKRMKRFGDGESFLRLLDQIRQASPQAGIRANFIVGFPGESEVDVDELMQFMAAAELDAIGIFAYSDEDGTAAAGLDGHLDSAEIYNRASDVSVFADTLMAIRAEARVGQDVEVLVESVDDGDWVGRATQQGPEDGHSLIRKEISWQIRPGDVVAGRICQSEGVDWVVNMITSTTSV